MWACILLWAQYLVFFLRNNIQSSERPFFVEATWVHQAGGLVFYLGLLFLTVVIIPRPNNVFCLTLNSALHSLLSEEQAASECDRGDGFHELLHFIHHEEQIIHGLTRTITQIIITGMFRTQIQLANNPWTK